MLRPPFLLFSSHLRDCLQPPSLASSTCCRYFAAFPSFPSFRLTSIRRTIAEQLSNKYKRNRVDAIGPDLAALEWLMECGATRVDMKDGRSIGNQREMREYLEHSLHNKNDPSTSTFSPSDEAWHKKWPNAPPGIHILDVDASDSAIANEGFKYLREVRFLRRLKLNFCDYFGDEAIRELSMGLPAKTLEDIEIVLNPCVSDGSVYWLVKLSSLRRAHFYFLPYVTNRTAFIRSLKIALPRCTVTFPEVSTVGYGYDEVAEKKSAKR